MRGQESISESCSHGVPTRRTGWRVHSPHLPPSSSGGCWWSTLCQIRMCYLIPSFSPPVINYVGTGPGSVDMTPRERKSSNKSMKADLWRLPDRKIWQSNKPSFHVSVKPNLSPGEIFPLIMFHRTLFIISKVGGDDMRRIKGQRKG